MLDSRVRRQREDALGDEARRARRLRRRRPALAASPTHPLDDLVQRARARRRPRSCSPATRPELGEPQADRLHARHAAARLAHGRGDVARDGDVVRSSSSRLYATSGARAPTSTAPDRGSSCRGPVVRHELAGVDAPLRAPRAHRAGRTQAVGPRRPPRRGTREARARPRSAATASAAASARSACPPASSGTSGTTSATPTRGWTPVVLPQVDRARPPRRFPARSASTSAVVLADEREDGAVVVGVGVDVEELRARAANAAPIAAMTRGVAPLGDVGHGLEHDPYPTKPCPADDASRRTAPAAGARSCGCSASCARTARRSSSRRSSRSPRRSPGSSSRSSPASSSTSSTATPTRACLALEIGAIVVLGLIRGALMYGRRMISGRQALGVEYDLRDELYSHFLRLSFGFYDRSQTGQLMSRATIDLQSVRFFLGYGLIFFAQHVVTIVVVTAVLFVYSWQLALVALAITPVIALHRLPLQPRLAPGPARRAADARRRRDGRRGVDRRASTSSSRSRRRSGGRASFTTAADVRLREDARRQPTARALRPAAHVPAARRAGARAARGRAHGDLGLAVARRVLRVQPPARDARHAAAHARHVDRAGAARDRGGRADLRDSRRARGGRGRAARRSRSRRGRASVAFEDVTFGYDPERPVLDGVDLDIPAGRTVALIGRTGSGKTTLAALVPRFYDVDAGTRARRRRRRARRRAALAAARDRRHLAGSVPLLGVDPRQHRARHARRAAGGGRGRRARRAGARVHPRAPAGLRHRRRRARDHALRRAAPAHRDRARAPHRPADPDPRRRDRVRRRDDRGEDPRGAARGHARPDDDHHRPPALDDRARGRDRRARRQAASPRAARRRSSWRTSAVFREIHEHGLLQQVVAG